MCLTDPLDLTWHKQQSLCKKGTIFVKRNSLARDILILFSAKHIGLYRVESIDENINSACDYRFLFILRESDFDISVEIRVYLSKLKLYRAFIEKFGCVIS